jgi:hypothetical protein
MTAESDREAPTAEGLGRPSTLVWIDSREAIIIRWIDGEARIERVKSVVPAHHRATGHVRHDPAIRHGGGGGLQTAGEPHRLEHLDRFVEEVGKRLPPGDRLLILGPGTVHERLVRHLLRIDAHTGHRRFIASEASVPLTDGQLTERLRAFAGVETRRQTVGAYRWTGPVARHPSGKARSGARRVVDKAPQVSPQTVPDE